MIHQNKFLVNVFNFLMFFVVFSSVSVPNSKISCKLNFDFLFLTKTFFLVNVFTQFGNIKVYHLKDKRERETRKQRERDKEKERDKERR
jgi:hypothetical protein